MRWLGRLFVTTLALLLIFEEWLWDSLRAFGVRWLLTARILRLQAWLAGLPPSWALATLLTPALVLLPFKLLALVALHRHDWWLGVGILIAAKLAGTAVATWLFAAVRPAALKIRWFASVYEQVCAVLAWAHQWLERQPAVRALRERLGRVRARWRAASAGSLARRVRAAARTLRRG